MVTNLCLQQDVVGVAGHMENCPAFCTERFVASEVAFSLPLRFEMVTAFILQSELRVGIAEVRFDYASKEAAANMRMHDRFGQTDFDGPQPQVCLGWRIGSRAGEAGRLHEVLSSAEEWTCANAVTQFVEPDLWWPVPVADGRVADFHEVALHQVACDSDDDLFRSENG